MKRQPIRKLWVLERTINCLTDCKKTGVYKLWHVQKPSILYIGSAGSTRRWHEGFLGRWKCHHKELTTKNHASTYLSRVVKKYGIDGLRFEIIEITEPGKHLQAEQKWLDSIKPFGRKGYNTCKIAGSSIGSTIALEKRARCKKIYQYDIQGNFIKEWCSMQEAARQTKIHVSTIMACAQGKVRHAGKYIWQYHKEKIQSRIDEKIYAIACYLNGKYQYTSTCNDVEKRTNVPKEWIYKCIEENKTETKTGWLFRKHNPNNNLDSIEWKKKPNYRYIIDGKQVDTILELCKEFGTNNRRHFDKVFKKANEVVENNKTIKRIQI